MDKKEIGLKLLIGASCLCLILSLVFLSFSFTGNAIASVSVRSSGQISSLLFLVGIIGVFSWVKKKRD